MAIGCGCRRNPEIHFTTLGKYPIGTKVIHKDKFNNPQEKEWYNKEYCIAKYNQFGTVYLTSLDGHPLWNHTGGIGVDNLIKVEDVMSFDMNQCKKGDKLISCHGMILTYMGRTNCNKFRHEVQYPDGGRGSRTDDGQVFTKAKFPEDHDIIGFYKEEKQQMIERNKEYDLKVTGEQLAWLYFVTARSCNEFGLNYKLEEQYSPFLFEGYPDSKTNGIGWDNIYRNDVNTWLNKLFKVPETEKEKNLRELKEKHEELGKAIQKLEQSN